MRWEMRGQYGYDCYCIGVTMAKLGYYVFDPIAAGIVGIVIIHSSVSVLSEAIGGMMDSSVEPERENDIKKVVKKVEGIKVIKSLVTRKSGQKIMVDMEVEVDPYTNMKRAKNIVEKSKEAISKAIENIGSINVYLRPLKTKVHNETE